MFKHKDHWCPNVKFYTCCNTLIQKRRDHFDSWPPRWTSAARDIAQLLRLRPFTCRCIPHIPWPLINAGHSEKRLGLQLVGIHTETQTLYSTKRRIAGVHEELVNTIRYHYCFYCSQCHRCCSYSYSCLHSFTQNRVTALAQNQHNMCVCAICN